MELEIIMFKETGKYYTSCIVKSEENIPIYDDRFDKYIKDNLPATINGYVVVRDTETMEGFHLHMYTTYQLKNI